MTQSLYKYRGWLHITDKYSYKYSMHLQEIQMLNHIQLWPLDVCTDKQRQDYQSCRITPTFWKQPYLWHPSSEVPDWLFAVNCQKLSKINELVEDFCHRL